VRAALSGWEPPREPALGAWLDDRDDALPARLVEAGWSELWTGPELLGAAVAGGVELGSAAAPVCLLDEAALGGALAVSGRVRHGTAAVSAAVPLPGGGLALGRLAPEHVREPTLDGTGTVRAEVADAERLPDREAAACWSAWNAVTLAYFAGLAGRALDRSVEHARAREQFGAPLASLPAVQARLADAALSVDAIGLLASAAADTPGGLDAPALLWAGDACSEVTASAHQVHGAVGFALETGLHALHRRAKAVQVWAGRGVRRDALTSACCGARREISRRRSRRSLARDFTRRVRRPRPRGPPRRDRRGRSPSTRRSASTPSGARPPE